MLDRFKRYTAAGVLLAALYVEMAARFGIPIAMIGGMLQPDNCTRGTPLCWSEGTQANVIGSFFYGLTGQFFVVCVVKRLNLFTTCFRLWLILCITSQFAYPFLAAHAIPLLIFLQVVRGFGTGVSVAYHLEFLNRWLPQHERNTYISIVGMVNFLGNGTAGLLASSLTERFGWRYYFYFAGGLFVVVLVMHVCFLALWPEHTLFARALTKIRGGEGSEEERGDVEGPPIGDIVLEEKGKEELPLPEPPAVLEEPSRSDNSVSLRSVLGRSYTWVFSIYALSWVLCLYNTLNTAPFYLSRVLGVDPATISLLNFGLCMTIVAFTLFYSFLGQRLDRYLPWLTCRLTFALTPMVVQVVVFAAFPHIKTFTGAIILLVISTIASASLFSCSVVSANIEMDPANASVIQAFFNGIGQAGGFLGPVLMAVFTSDNPSSAAGWGKFFYCLSGGAVLAVGSVLASAVFRGKEWKNRSETGEPYKT